MHKSQKIAETVDQGFIVFSLRQKDIIVGFVEQNILIMTRQTTEYKEQGYRFVIITFYVLTCLVNSIPVHTFSSINVIVEEKFHISDIQVTLNGLLFTITHPIFAFPFNFLINKYGMRPCFIIAAILVCSGVWLRLLLEVDQSVFCLLGSALAALGNIVVLNTPSKVALNWFRKERVGIVTFTGVLGSIISNTIGASVPSFIVDKQTSVEGVRTFLMGQAIVVSVPYVLLTVFFREKPNLPPSKAAEAVFNQKRQSYLVQLKKLFKNKDYLKLMVSMGFNYGTLTALMMVLDQMLAGLEYHDSGNITSITIASAMILGILSNPFFSYLLRKTKAYRAVLGLNTFGGFFMATLLLIAYIFKVHSTWKIIVLGGAIGLFTIPFPSIVISYASEVVFPVDEGSSAGYLFAASQTFGFLLGFGSISYLNKTQLRSKIVIFVCIGLFFLSFLAAIWVKQKLNKLRFEQSEYSHYSKAKSQLKASLVVQDQALK